MSLTTPRKEKWMDEQTGRQTESNTVIGYFSMITQKVKNMNFEVHKFWEIMLVMERPSATFCL